MDLPETTLWWTQQQQQPILVVEPIQDPSTSGPPFHPSWPLQHHQPTWFSSHNPTTTTPHFNLNNQNDDDDEEEEENDDDANNNSSDQATTTHEGAELEDEKEAMFEKPLTPSDVGKLNRLVIPKQHAEKYFPLGASGGGGDTGECKGLLLSFEDESGKCWRFRYSYWNSSQSYVLTKGWSRYVKDKRLYAGDVVLFERHRADNQRLFIGWRRRKPSGPDPAHVSKGMGHDGNNSSIKNEVGVGVGVVVGGGGGTGGVGVGWTRGFYSAHSYPAHQLLPYQHDHCLHAVRGSQGQNQRTRSVGNSSSSSSSSRVLRLFGVNMECQPEQHDSGTSTPQCSYSSNTMPSTLQGTDTHHFYHYHQPPPHSPNPRPHMVRHQPYYY